MVGKVRTHTKSAPGLPMRMAMISRKAEPDAPGRFSLWEISYAYGRDEARTYRGPEQMTTTILSSQPMRPVPTTAMKIAEGAGEYETRAKARD